MIVEKKRIQAKPIEKTQPKQRLSKEVEVKIEIPIIESESEPIKQKRTRVETSKYVKISIAEAPLKFKEIGDRVQKKELKWAFYEGDGAIGYHYYRIIGTQDL